MSDAFQPAGAIGEDQLHDLRNRLTVVKGVAQLLDRQVRQDDWHREKIIARVDRLQEEIALLEQLVDGYDSDSPAHDSDRRRDVLH